MSDDLKGLYKLDGAAFILNADGVIGSLSLTPRSAASAVTSLEVRIGMPADGVHVTPFRTEVAVPRSRSACQLPR